METLEAVGWMVVIVVLVGVLHAPLLMVIFERSFLEEGSAEERTEGGDCDDE